MSDKLIMTVDSQIAALVPRFFVNWLADVHARERVEAVRRRVYRHGNRLKRVAAAAAQ
jgi:hypothetical protein